MRRAQKIGVVDNKYPISHKTSNRQPGCCSPRHNNGGNRTDSTPQPDYLSILKEESDLENPQVNNHDQQNQAHNLPEKSTSRKTGWKKWDINVDKKEEKQSRAAGSKRYRLSPKWNQRTGDTSDDPSDDLDIQKSKRPKTWKKWDLQNNGESTEQQMPSESQIDKHHKAFNKWTKKSGKRPNTAKVTSDSQQKTSVKVPQRRGLENDSANKGSVNPQKLGQNNHQESVKKGNLKIDDKANAGSQQSSRRASWKKWNLKDDDDKRSAEGAPKAQEKSHQASWKKWNLKNDKEAPPEAQDSSRQKSWKKWNLKNDNQESAPAAAQTAEENSHRASWKKMESL